MNNYNKMKINISVIFTIGLLFGLITTTNAKEAKVGTVTTVQTVESPTRGKMVDFSFEKDGKTIMFSDYVKGKVVFLNFWGTWCGPCRKEIPDIIKIAKELEGKDFIVVGIALERPSKNMVGRVEDFVKSQGINYINILDTEGSLKTAYGGVPYVPTTFIIDKDGNVNKKIQGMQSYEAFMSSIKKVL